MITDTYLSRKFPLLGNWEIVDALLEQESFGSDTENEGKNPELVL